jgi:hypothetical protein
MISHSITLRLTRRNHGIRSSIRSTSTSNISRIQSTIRISMAYPILEMALHPSGERGRRLRIIPTRRVPSMTPQPIACPRRPRHFHRRRRRESTRRICPSRQCMLITITSSRISRTNISISISLLARANRIRRLVGATRPKPSCSRIATLPHRRPRRHLCAAAPCIDRRLPRPHRTATIIRRRRRHRRSIMHMRPRRSTGRAATNTATIRHLHTLRRHRPCTQGRTLSATFAAAADSPSFPTHLDKNSLLRLVTFLINIKIHITSTSGLSCSMAMADRDPWRSHTHSLPPIPTSAFLRSMQQRPQPCSKRPCTIRARWWEA